MSLRWLHRSPACVSQYVVLPSMTQKAAPVPTSASPFLMRRKEGQGEAHVFNHRTFERKLTWPLCLCPSLIHILNLSEVTALQKWHPKLRPGTVCRAAGSSWDRIPPLVLHAASVTQVCSPFCLNLLSGIDLGLLEPPGPLQLFKRSFHETLKRC